MKRWRFPIVLLLAAAAAGCAAPGGGTGATPADPPETTMPRSFEPVGPLPTGPGDEQPPAGDGSGEVPAELLAQVRADAADRTGTPPEAIEVLRARSVIWRDGSLGCPEPGMMYTMALVPGYHVVLRAGDEELDYRATEAGAFRICTSPAPSGTLDPAS